MGAASSGLRADAVLLFITGLWGITFVAVKDALALADPLSFLALRFTVGAAAATAAAIASRNAAALTRRSNAGAGLLLSGFLFAGYALQTFGLERTSPSRSAFITGLSVLLVPFLSIAVFRRWPRGPSLLGVLMAVSGLQLLTGVDAAAGFRTGDLLTLGCAVAFAFHIVLTEKLAPGRPVSALVAVQLASTALLSAACVPLGGFRVQWTWALAGALLFCGVFASALAILLQTWAQARTSAVRAALIFSLEPVFAALYSLAAGRERLGLREAAGGALIVLGVATAEAGNAFWARLRERRASAERALR
ncbi:MAG: DMT family transporter [Myxococcales bacterium]|nr:DMT family transporter [Myxococcales bacterium]